MDFFCAIEGRRLKGPCLYEKDKVQLLKIKGNARLECLDCSHFKDLRSKTDKRKMLSDEMAKRVKYRSEFVKRAPEFQRVKEKIENGISHYEKKGLSPNILAECLKLFRDPEGDAKDIQESILELIESQSEKGEPLGDGLAHLVASRDISSIEIVSTEGKRITKTSYLNHFEPDQVFYGKGHALNASDKEEKTVLIKIHLDRKKEEVGRDIKFLYDLLHWEVMAFDLDPKLRSKRPRWDEYEKSLKVYDLKKANKEWSEIAKVMFPERMEEHEAPRRKTRKPQKPSSSAIEAVRHLHEEAKKMIEGGWRRI